MAPYQVPATEEELKQKISAALITYDADASPFWLSHPDLERGSEAHKRELKRFLKSTLMRRWPGITFSMDTNIDAVVDPRFH